MTAKNLRTTGAMLLAGGTILFTSFTMTGCKDETTSPTTGPTVVSITIKDNAIDIVPGTLKVGSTKFLIKNAGAIEHSFEIEEESTAHEWFNKVLAPNQTDSLTVTLTEGNWEFYDPHHETDGVDHDIIVTK